LDFNAFALILSPSQTLIPLKPISPKATCVSGFFRFSGKKKALQMGALRSLDEYENLLAWFSGDFFKQS